MSQQVEADIRLVPVADLHQSPDNPRRISDRDFERLRKSIRDDPAFMHMRPVLARPDGSVYAGNMRLEAAKAEGWTEVPTIVTDDPEAVIRQRAIKDNASYGEWIVENLAEYLSGLGDMAPEFDLDALAIPDDLVRQMGFESAAGIADLSRTVNEGFGASALAERAADGSPGHPNFRDDDTTLEDAPAHLEGVLQLADNIDIRGDNYWNIPDLRRDMLLTPDDVANMKCWSDQKTTPPEDDVRYLWNYGLAPAAGLPMERALLAFYTNDHHFENWWALPAYYTAKVLNVGLRMAIVPDFSMYSDWANATVLQSVYRAQWLGRYFQEAGIRVMPRVNWPGRLDEDMAKWLWLGIPEDAPVVAICLQSHDVKTELAAYTKRVQYGLGMFVERFRPQAILNYSGPPGHRMVHDMNLGIPVMDVMNYVGVRRNVAFDRGASHTDSPRDDNPNVGGPGATFEVR